MALPAFYAVLCVEDILVQAGKRLLQQRQVHPQVTGAVEHPPVLHRHANGPCHIIHVVNGFVMGKGGFLGHAVTQA